jgi:RNA polymerase sigma-70 factor (ECF subfamily)
VRFVGVSVGRIDTEAEPTDAEIIFESLENPERFREIFRRHYDLIFRFTVKRVGRDLAADLTADVFVRAFQLRARYDVTRPLCRPWLYGIASNVVGDHLRRRNVGLGAALVLPPEPADAFTAVDDRVVSQGQAAALSEAVSKLRRSDRDVLFLYALEELSYAEIAESLAIPIGTVRSRLARARRRMRELLPDLEQTTDTNGETDGE